MAIKLADTARPNNYVDAEHLGTYPVAYAEDVWFADGTRLSEKTFSGDSFQVDELPYASEDELGNVYQYLGANGTYKHGHFYECVGSGIAFNWQELILSTDDAVKNVDALPTGYDVGNYVYGTRGNIESISCDYSDSEIVEFHAYLEANGFTLTDISAGDPYREWDYILEYPKPIDIYIGNSQWLTPDDYTQIRYSSNSAKIIVAKIIQQDPVRYGTWSWGQGEGEEFLNFVFAEPPKQYYVGDATNQTTTRLALYSDLPTNVDSLVEYLSTPPDYEGSDYKEGAVIVYSGEDNKGFLQGHHYKHSTNFLMAVNQFRIYLNEEHSSFLSTYINADEEPKVGTHLYNKNGDTYWFYSAITSIDSEYISIYDRELHTYIYGWEIVDNPENVTITYDWVDIGGGGDGGSDYDEFVGTQAEWDALSQSQKDKYDGRVVNITDDEGGIDSFYPSAPTTPTVVFDKSNQSSNIDATYTVEKKAFYIVKVHTYSEGQGHAAQVSLNGILIGTESSYSATSGVGYTVTIPCNIGDVIGMIVSCGGSGTYDKRHAIIYRLD